MQDTLRWVLGLRGCMWNRRVGDAGRARMRRSGMLLAASSPDSAMGIKFRCRECDKKLHVKTFLAGKRGVCPRCGAKIRIPRVGQATPPSAAGNVERRGAVPDGPAGGRAGARPATSSRASAAASRSCLLSRRQRNRDWLGRGHRRCRGSHLRSAGCGLVRAAADRWPIWSG